MKGPILKSRDEIAVMDRVNRVVLDILEIMRGMVKPGATTAQLNAVAEEELAKRGAKSPFIGYAQMGLPPYPAVVCASVNDVIVHGIPNRTRLAEGDVLGLDFGAILDGFVGDGAITIPVAWWIWSRALHGPSASGLSRFVISSASSISATPTAFTSSWVVC